MPDAGQGTKQHGVWIGMGLGCALALLLLACSTTLPAPTPTVPTLPSASPTTTSTPTPTVPSASPTPSAGPTWTPLPLPTASAVPTATPPWPSPPPTPTPAAPLAPGMQAATFFFYWHNCPAQNCNPAKAYAVPPGWGTPLAGDPDPADGLYYSTYNQYWYLQELRDMRLAGIDIVLPVSWGDHPFPWFRTAVLAGLVEANRQLDPPLRIGLFDDTTSQVSEYRDYADNQRFDASAYFDREPAMDLRDPSIGWLFYDRKILPFFRTIPQEMWATHNGRPVEEGGRPLIVVYTTNGMTHLEQAGALWTSIKNAFARDFHDRNGQPITPWLVLEISWFTDASMGGRPSISEVADGKFVWGSALNGLQVRDWRDFTVTSVGPGFDDRSYYGPGRPIQPRNRDPDGGQGDPGTFFRWSLDQVPPRTDLLLIETWNELWEGTSICRADYPDIEGQPVRDDFYLDMLRQNLRGQGLWWAAQPLPPPWPSQLAAGQIYYLDLPVRNIGARSWSAESGEYLEIQGSLLPQPYASPPDAPVHPGEQTSFLLPLTAPAAPGHYTVTWQMMGPEGPFGPPGNWTIAVGPAAVPGLEISGPVEPVAAGRPFSLTVRLSSPLRVVAARLQVRFDPLALHLQRMEPPPDSLERWSFEADNERGQGFLETYSLTARTMDDLAELQFLALLAGESGVWIERVELDVETGATVTMGPLWVPLTVR